MTIKVSKFYSAVSNHVIHCSGFKWDCYGEGCRIMGAEMDSAEATAIISPDGEIREVSLRHEDKEIVWIDPKYRAAEANERTSRNIEQNHAIRSEYGDALIAKISDIFHVNDGKVDMEIELDTDLLFSLMEEAHKRNITLNEFVEIILTAELKRVG